MIYNKLKDEDHAWKMQVSDAIDNWPDRVDEKDKRVLDSLAIKIKYQFPAKCTKYKNGKATSTKMVYYNVIAMRELEEINGKLQRYFKHLDLDTGKLRYIG